MTNLRQSKGTKHVVMAHLRMVERFLQTWDPIAVVRDQAESGVPPSEYDAYAPHVLSMLQQGCSAEALAGHLAAIRSGMGLGRDDAADAALSRGLVAWFRNAGDRSHSDADS